MRRFLRLVRNDLMRKFENQRNRALLKSCGQSVLSCSYNTLKDSILNGLCEKYGSDKGAIKDYGHPYPWPSHTYADFYERLFGHCRFEIKNVFECGLGSNNINVASNMTINGKPGASLRVWRDYFPNANIYGADIDRDILFAEERIQTFYCDQTNRSSIASLWDQVKDVKFCLMIDDGLHTFDAGVALFENSFHMLRDGGVYIIEDVNVKDTVRFRNHFNSKQMSCDIVSSNNKGYPFGEWSLVVARK
jgi:hypothetical protein